ncbi:AAA family ATPase [Actinospica sp. MGRD01-02]|uniref:DNA 3'-5' helicase n=1 Tax=Actinospica acidithermotolerans TaxID=2828514 RepID=A0A941IIE7_9ACTN|nr:UvrD-helicase domain-containing protein [Actinospica acidithermotolerans]MBR7824681.1 AAA family ATPase [Actinospica acidithermotolerans]
MLASEFLPAYAKLEPPVRARVQSVFGKFAEHTFAGLHLEKLQNPRDERVRTIRIDKFWRGVVLAPESGDQYCLINVLPHDEAIAFARTRQFSVNQALGVIEMRDAENLELIAPALRVQAAQAPERLFEAISDKDLLRLGIEPDLLPLVRDITSEAALQVVERLLPQAQADVLTALASGLTVEETWAEVSAGYAAQSGAAGTADAGDLGAALQRSRSFAVAVDGEAELSAILSQPFDAWRVFLHPSQHRLAYAPSYTGPALVTGAAGTGKTVVALHRAVYLARSRPELPVLLTTFTRALSDSLRASLAKLDADPDVLGAIDVQGVDQLAYSVFAEQRASLGEQWAVASAADQAAAWRHALAETQAPFAAEFLSDEWEHVVLAQDLTTAEQYLACTRTGRGGTLGPRQRETAWQAINAAAEHLREANRWTFLQIAAEAARYQAEQCVPRYRHAVIDESQDLHPAHWRLLRACVAPNVDDLFLVGDPHQRIYRNNASLRSLGIEVRGRSRKLTLGYRSTGEILDYATHILTGEHVADLEDDQQQDSLAGYRSLLHGRKPTVRAAAHRAEELDALAARVRQWLDEGIPAESIVVAARTRHLVDEAAQALRVHELDAVVIDKATADGGGVRVCTMHKLKGLEFQCVALIAVEAGVIPPAQLGDDPADLMRERCLLFVAATRARDSLHVSYSGEPSRLLPGQSK